MDPLSPLLSVTNDRLFKCIALSDTKTALLSIMPHLYLMLLRLAKACLNPRWSLSHTCSKHQVVRVETPVDDDAEDAAAAMLMLGSLASAARDSVKVCSHGHARVGHGGQVLKLE